MPEELSTEVSNIVQEAVMKITPKKEKYRRQNGCRTYLQRIIQVVLITEGLFGKCIFPTFAVYLSQMDFLFV